MAVTFTRSLERDARREHLASVRVGAGDSCLIAASTAAVLVILAAFLGRMAVFDRTDPANARAAINLNTLTDPAQLEPALGTVLDSPSDRRFAARELFASLAPSEGARRPLRNVGGLTRVDVPVAAVESDSGLVGYRERLRAARARAAAAGAPAPERLSLVTPADLPSIKSSFVVRDRSQFRRAVLLWVLLYLAAFQAVSVTWRMRGLRGDRVLLAVAHVLTAVGFAAMLSRPDPLRDTPLFVRYSQGIIAGLAVMLAVSLVNFRKSALREFSYLPLVAAVILSAMLIAFGSGPSGSNAKVNLGPIQPIETIRLLLGLFLASYFARRWELLRAVRSVSIRGRPVPVWINAPRLDYVLPLIGGVGLALALFFLQRDLGPALVVAAVFLAMYAVARASAIMTLGGFVLLAAGCYLGYRLRISSVLADRVVMWQSPWDNAARGGDQIAQAIWGLATGGLLGTGSGLGDTRYLPAGHTDLILAAAGEELGMLGVLFALLLYATLVWRGLSIARRASSDYGFFLAVAATLLIGVPVVLMTAGVLGLVPLTGVVTPFLSYGGSAMVANFACLGLLAALRSDLQERADLQPFLRPVGRLGMVLAAAGAVLVAAAARVQVLRADEWAVKSHLGMQADGSRRYQYNPRVLDAARQIPRGSVLDRRGLPLATDDRALLRRSANEYGHLGIDVNIACADVDARCYPLDGRAFHLLGDARTRLNWSATNTSFVERESEARLRGFNDHQTTVRTVDASGTATWVLRRDFSELLPLLRHRYNPRHRSVRALLARSRDVQLTVDALLQIRVARIVAGYASKSQSGRLAAIVLDPDTGDLLASVSHPWPDEGKLAGDPHTRMEPLLDRARYGLYPPGSTFKLVTAAAALRRDRLASRRQFTCIRLPDGRVGTRLPGWGHPVRDDVLDRKPHGTIDMRTALTASCNAYFAQLALVLGPEALVDTAERVHVSLTRSNSLARVRDTLPQIGYGQGEVLATPLRLARVAAAIADGGVLREGRLEQSAAAPAGERFLPVGAADLLARYMREVVLDGTARALRNHPVAIAGKTGTAEIEGASSHSWFIGFAPYGPAKKRIAVAVIAEHAGYGSGVAVPAAGEIISAAASLGLVR